MKITKEFLKKKEKEDKINFIIEIISALILILIAISFARWCGSTSIEVLASGDEHRMLMFNMLALFSLLAYGMMCAGFVISIFSYSHMRFHEERYHGVTFWVPAWARKLRKWLCIE